MKTEEYINLLGQSYTVPANLSGSIGVGSGTISISTGTGTANPHQFIARTLPPVTLLEVLQQTYYDQPDPSKAVIDQIQDLIDKLSQTTIDHKDENQLSAVKHLTYAKAFLEKMLLDKINEKTNGHS